MFASGLDRERRIFLRDRYCRSLKRSFRVVYGRPLAMAATLLELLWIDWL
jgi:hypothetical protein